MTRTTRTIPFEREYRSVLKICCSMKKLLLFSLLLAGAFQLQAQTSQSAYRESIQRYREEYKKDFITDERAPLRTKRDLSKLRFYEPDERFRVACTFERTPDEKPFDLPTFDGSSKQFVKYGILRFELDSQEYRLAVYQNLAIRNVPEYAQYLFLPFRDWTNGEATYGGGRYLDLMVSDVEAEVVFLDFNKSYNPWCAYSDGYVCPIPPAENSLETAIEAGEKMWVGRKKK